MAELIPEIRQLLPQDLASLDPLVAESVREGFRFVQRFAAHSGTLSGRFPTLAEVADYAAFVASDRAGAMTGAIAHVSCGSLVD